MVCDDKIRNPTGFWKAYNDCANLQDIAMLVLSYVPHTASCERNWSCHKLMHTSSRNRMSISSARMISRIKQDQQKRNVISSTLMTKQLQKLVQVESNLTMDFLFGPIGHDDSGARRDSPLPIIQSEVSETVIDIYEEGSTSLQLLDLLTENDVVTDEFVLNSEFDLNQDSIEEVPAFDMPFNLDLFDKSPSTSSTIQQAMQLMLPRESS
ncbi:hypothetical protein AC1031_014851 [Aphanomyces cochlioides]|nr:hypothetical protein AC1031_014851 [Aphanomyces cochlioides]